MNVEEKRLAITFRYCEAASLPKRLSVTKNTIYLNGVDEQATLYLPLLKGELKHYFKDYKNYYYLPKEDMAVHKSVATYVEPENKKGNKKHLLYKEKRCLYFLPRFFL